MKRNFVLCAHCAEHKLEEVWTTSADISEYCASGHFFQPKRSQFDGRPEAVILELDVERNESKDIVAEDRTKIRNGGDYDYFCFTVNPKID